MSAATRRLLLTWALLMSLTATLGFAGDVVHAGRLGAPWLAVIGLVTVVKARLVLARYLRLEVAPSFLAGFTAALVLTVALIVASFALVHRPLMRPPTAIPTLRLVPPR